LPGASNEDASPFCVAKFCFQEEKHANVPVLIRKSGEHNVQLRKINCKKSIQFIRPGLFFFLDVSLSSWRRVFPRENVKTGGALRGVKHVAYWTTVLVGPCLPDWTLFLVQALNGGFLPSAQGRRNPSMPVYAGAIVMLTPPVSNPVDILVTPRGSMLPVFSRVPS